LGSWGVVSGKEVVQMNVGMVIAVPVGGAYPVQQYGQPIMYGQPQFAPAGVYAQPVMMGQPYYQPYQQQQQPPVYYGQPIQQAPVEGTSN
jgi:hypothetical protein